MLWIVTYCSRTESDTYYNSLLQLDKSLNVPETHLMLYAKATKAKPQHVFKSDSKTRMTVKSTGTLDSTSVNQGLTLKNGPVDLLHREMIVGDKSWQQLSRSLSDTAYDVQQDLPCPKWCKCGRFEEKTITKVDCSSRGLITIPKFPSTAREIQLQNNSIRTVPCTSFNHIVNLKYLDVSHNIIDSLFNCSFQSLHFLEHLIMSSCELSQLPQGIFKTLRSLQTLNLSKNNLNHLLPLTFKGMNQLKHLDLHQNELKKIKNNTFEGLKLLHFLSLQCNSLLYTPDTFESDAFQGLSKLRTLLIHENQQFMTDDFIYPDQALSRVPSLRWLRMDGWPRALGTGFSSLTNLTYLHFGVEGKSYCNMGSSIPSDFFAPLSTKKPLILRMPRCGLTMLPTSLFKPLSSLIELDLGENSQLGFSTFEYGSAGLQNSNLQVLNLTRIVVPDGTFHSIKSTTFRHLKSTKLQTLLLEWDQLLNISPKALEDLPLSLEYISLYNNRLQNGNFLATVLRFRNLRVFRLSRQLTYGKENSITRSVRKNSLNLSVNHLVKTQSESNWKIFERTTLQHLQGKKDILDTLKFSPNKMNEILGQNNKFCGHSKDMKDKKMSSSVWPFPLQPNLEIILASDIKVSYDIPEIHITNNEVLRYIDYSKNGVKCFGGPISGVPSLTYLDLSRNWCLKMNHLFFLNMTALKTLLLYENMLGQSLADDIDGVTFSTLVNLEVLSLRYNSIKDMSEHAFVNNTALRLLDISHNDLVHFRPSLSNTKTLDSLDLTQNRLQGFSQSTCNHLRKIKKINTNFQITIDNNDFQCNCDNLQFLKLLIEQPSIFKNFQNFRCELANGSSLEYYKVSEYLPELEIHCVAIDTFGVVLACFFLTLAGLLVSSVYHYKRWKLKYLTYVGKTRLHIGARHITFKPMAQVFVTYDQVSSQSFFFWLEMCL